MSRPIDEKIVQMRMDTANFIKKAQEVVSTMGGIDKAISSVGSMSFGGATTGFADLATSIVDTEGRITLLGMTAANVLGGIARDAMNAGAQLIHSFAIEPVTDGFNEYELKMSNIKTIMNGTGESLERVSEKLNELNDYSDRTIYSFKDMTENIGKFTNAGVSLDDAVSAIQGISSAAAHAGAGTGAASIAMFNLSQALATGTVKLIDWISIEKAGMATMTMKQVMLDNAVAIGTLTEAGDGLYTALNGTTFGIDDFRNSLTDGEWLTSDVLISGLKNFTDETTEIGKAAMQSATEVRTFSSMVGTIKESVGSGWAQSFEIIFGNLEVATELFTGVTEAITGAEGSMADARNTFLQGMRDMGGFENMWRGLGNVIKNVAGFINSVKTAWRNVFPPASYEEVVGLTEKFEKFTESLIMTEDKLGSITTLFTGIFDVFSRVGTIIGNLAKAFLNLIPTSLIELIFPLSDGMGTVLSITSRLLDPIIWLSEVIEKITGVIGALVNGVLNGLIDGLYWLTQHFANLGEVATEVWDSIAGFLNNIWEGFEPVITKVKEFIETIDLKGFAKLGLIAGLAWLGKKMFGWAKAIVNPIDTIKGAVNGFSVNNSLPKFIDIFKESLSKFTAAITPMNVIAIAAAITALSVSLKILAGLNTEDISKGLVAMTGVMAVLGGSLFIVSLINFDDLPMFSIAVGLVGIASAISIMAPAIMEMSSLDANALGRGLTAMTGAITAMIAGLFALSKINDLGIRTALNLVFMAKAIKTAATSFVELGQLNWDQVAVAGTTFAGIVTGLVLASKFAEGFRGSSFVLMAVAIKIVTNAVLSTSDLEWESLAKGLTTIAVAMIGMGTAAFFAKNSGMTLLWMALGLRSLVKPIEQLGMLDFEVLKHGIGSLAIMLGIMTAAAKLMGGNKVAFTITALANSMRRLVKPIEQLGMIDLWPLTKGLGALAGTMLSMGLAAAMARKGGIGLALMAVGTKSIAKAIKMLEETSLWDMIKAIGTFAIAMAAFAGLAVLISPAAGAIAIFAGAMLLLNVAMIAGAAALAIFTSALGALSLITVPTMLAIGASLGTLVFVVGELLTYILIKVVQIIADTALEIGKQAPKLVEAFGLCIQAVVDGFDGWGPPLADAFVLLLETVMSKFAEHAPTIAEKMFQVIKSMVVIVVEKVPELAALLIEGLINLINGLASAIVQYSEPLWNAVQNVLYSLMVLVIDGLVAVVETFLGFIPGVSENAGRIGEVAKGALRDAWNIDETELIAFEGMSAFNSAIDDGSGGATAAGDKLGYAATAAAEESLVLAPIAESETLMFNDTLTKHLNKTRANASKLGSTAEDGASEMDLETVASQGGEGFARGFESPTLHNRIWNAAGGMGSTVINAVKKMLNINSPSRVLKTMGGYGGEGFVNGIKGSYSAVSSAGRSMASRMIESVQNAYKSIENLSLEELELNPRIVPVIDLSGITGVDIGGVYRPEGDMSYYQGQGGIENVNIDGITINIETRDNEQAQETMAEFSSKVRTVLKDELRKVKKV